MRPMARALLQRPSVYVAAWTCLVVGAFVWNGDLRLAQAGQVADRPVDQPVVGAPEIVRLQVPPASPASTQRRARVFDALGFLVVGAEVVPMDRAPLRTDGDGEFTIDFGSRGIADLLVRADGQQPRWWRTTSGSPDALALRLVPAAPWDELAAPLAAVPALRGEGVVRHPDGSPLAGAGVLAVGSGLWARSDDFGRFAVPLPLPSTSLVVHAPEGGTGDQGFALAATPVVPERNRGAVPLPDLVAAPALAIRGIVRDPRGQPLVGVPVEIEGPVFRRVVDTGAGGAFRCGGLAAGSYTVQPFAWRGALGLRRDVALADTSVDLDLQLVAAEEVRLRVVDERGGPAAGVYVATSVGGARRGVARADAHGYAAVPLAASTEFDVRTAKEWAPVPVRRFEEPATLVVAMP